MPCDIHCYVEYKSPKSDYWESFGGRFDLERDYDLFGRLAGLRRSSVAPLVEPRGIPNDLAFSASNDYWVYICHDPDTSGTQVRPGIAAKWVSGGAKYKPGDSSYVANPDWHTATWLTGDEFATALADYTAHEYDALLAAMQSLEASGYVTRLVMWFDN